MDAAPGMLTGGTMPEYLYRRTNGVVGLLERLIEDGCREAIDTGTEHLDQALLDNVALSLPDAAQPRRRGGRGPRHPARTRPVRRQAARQARAQHRLRRPRPGDRDRSRIMTRETDKLSPLPRSLDPLPDESLPGYLLRLAHRLGLAPARVMQLTGLTAGRDGHQPARRSLMLHLDEAPAGAFARVTRLTAAEASQLCMGSMSGRYPWAAPRVTADKWGPRSLASPWVFTSATRYCPQCLAGDGSHIQQQHGGAWQKAWRLPVVFACPAHRRLLEHLCPPAGSRPCPQRPGAPAWLIPRAGDGGLHPAQCRAALKPQAAGRHARPCGARLDAPARAGEDSPVSDDLLALQGQLLQLLDPEGPAAVMSVGQPATPAQYFADLRLVCSLINGAWPHSRNLITGPGMAESLDRYIASTGGAAPRRHTLCDAPPLDARPGAALITAAIRILDGGDLRVLGELLAPARDGASRKSPRGRWIRRYQRAGHDCSDGFRDALEPLINSFQRAGRRSRGRRAPAPQINFAPEHVPEHLQDDWYSRALPPHRREHPAAPPRRRPPPGPDVRRRLARRGGRLPRHRPPLPQSIPRLSSVSPTTRQSSASRCTRSPGSSAPPRT